MTARAGKPRKPGRLSKADRTFIERFKDALPPAELAKKLGRTEKAVLDALGRATPVPAEVRHAIGTGVDAPLPVPPEEEAPPPASGLRASKAWKHVRQQLLPDEVGYFEEQYEDLMLQFRDDVLATEKTQVFKVIMLSVLMNRVAKEQRDLAAAAADARRRLQPLADKAARGEELSDYEQGQVALLQERLADGFAKQSSLTADFAKLEDKHQKLMDDLKATRKQRVDWKESGKVDFLGAIRVIATDDRARRDSEHFIELTRRAYAAELARLARPHRYADSVIDQPVLNCDTVGLYPDYAPPLTTDPQGGR